MEKQKLIKKLSRRNFIRNSVIAATGATLLPSLLTSCSDDGFFPIGDYGFFEGVASFDPTQARVIPWSRYTPAPNENGKTSYTS